MRLPATRLRKQPRVMKRKMFSHGFKQTEHHT